MRTGGYQICSPYKPDKNYMSTSNCGIRFEATGWVNTLKTQSDGDGRKMGNIQPKVLIKSNLKDAIARWSCYRYGKHRRNPNVGSLHGLYFTRRFWLQTTWQKGIGQMTQSASFVESNRKRQLIFAKTVLSHSKFGLNWKPGCIYQCWTRSQCLDRFIAIGENVD